MTANLKLFVWDTDIGQMVAHAVDVNAARNQLYSLLPPGDYALGELKDALSVEPVIKDNQAFAMIAWAQ